MLSFIYNYQSILILVGVLLLLVLAVYALKKLPAKVDKKKKVESNKDSQPEIKTEDKTEIAKAEEVAETQKNDELSDDKKTQDDEKKLKKEDKKPKIVQIYKRSEKKNYDTASSKQDFDPIYNRNVEFINTSKNIAKFKSFVEDTAKQQEESEEQKDEFGFVADVKEDCNFCKDEVKHFDHSKRLSLVMKEDQDIFASHISDKYLNINMERHLNSERIERNLNKRVEDMLLNSSKKVNCEHAECLNEECEMCEDDLDDEVKVDMKTALIAETYFKRKGRR